MTAITCFDAPEHKRPIFVHKCFYPLDVGTSTGRIRKDSIPHTSGTNADFIPLTAFEQHLNPKTPVTPELVALGSLPQQEIRLCLWSWAQRHPWKKMCGVIGAAYQLMLSEPTGVIAAPAGKREESWVVQSRWRSRPPSNHARIKIVAPHVKWHFHAIFLELDMTKHEFILNKQVCSNLHKKIPINIFKAFNLWATAAPRCHPLPPPPQHGWSPQGWPHGLGLGAPELGFSVHRLLQQIDKQQTDRQIGCKWYDVN